MLSRMKLVVGLTAFVCSPLLSAPDVMRVHFIDVGQGAATLVEFPSAAILIDTGGERWPHEGPEVRFDSTQELISYLREFFATRPELQNKLALLALTHPHKDHTRGVYQVIRNFQPLNVIHNGQLTGSGIYGQDIARNYLRDSEARGYYVLERSIDSGGLSNSIIDPVNPGQGSGLTDPRIRVLWGQVKDEAGWKPEDFTDENNHSLVIRIDFGASSILFPGDLEEPEEPGGEAGIEKLLKKYQGTSLLDVDVYHVGHHGSHNGTTRALLDALNRLKMAVISAGPAVERGEYSAWDHGHPRTDTVRKLEAAVDLNRTAAKDVLCFDAWGTMPSARRMEKAVYSTGWDGTVVLEATPSGSWKVVSLKGQRFLE